MMEKRESTFERFQDQLGKPTISEKLDYKTVLISGLNIVQQAILQGIPSVSEAAIWSLYNLIPTNWHDEQFKKDIEVSYYVWEKDIRPIVVAGVRMSEEACKKNNIPTFIEIKCIDYFKMLNACVNLMERLGVLMRRTPKAWLQGKSGVEPIIDNGVHQL